MRRDSRWPIPHGGRRRQPVAAAPDAAESVIRTRRAAGRAAAPAARRRSRAPPGARRAGRRRPPTAMQQRASSPTQAAKRTATRSFGASTPRSGWVRMRTSSTSDRRATASAVVATPAATASATPRATVATQSQSASTAVTASSPATGQPSAVQPMVEGPPSPVVPVSSWNQSTNRTTSSASAPRPASTSPGRSRLTAEPRARSPACARAASSVLRSRQAIVIGPTPPGTGVIAPATCATSSKATSPASPSAVRLMPTSITVAPGLTQSPRTIPARPTAAIRTSARRQTAARSRVREWQMVTVAFAAEQQLGHRLAEEVRAADDHGLGALELGAAPARAAASRRSGCTGAGPGGPSASSPALTGVRPSTSLAGSIRPVSRTPSRCAGHRQLARGSR